MSSIRTISLAAALSVLGSISRVSAHGFVSGIVIGGQYYPGFNPAAAPYQHPPPASIGWPNAATDTGFVSPHAFGNGDIVCHLNGSPGEKHAAVAAGSSIDLQWNSWPESHHGPVIDYMAKCDGDCEKADRNALKFFKIHEAGLVNGSPAPGKWASDDLIAHNNTWTVTVPASIAPGNYVLRHEIIALHSADKADGAQNYPQCINLQVTGSGTENPAGIPATKFYTPTDPGIFLSIYYPALKNYTIPGPALFGGGSSGASSGNSTASPSSASSMSMSSITADASGSTSASKAPTSVETSVKPSMTTSPVYRGASTTTEEMNSTTTTDTTITLTTTAESGSTPTDVCPTSSEVAPVSTSSAETSSKASETADYTSPAGAAAYASDASATPTESSMSSSAAASPTSESPSAVDSPAAPTASGVSGGSDSGLPGGMSMQQFIDWLNQFLAKYFSDKGNGRKHARDLVT